MQTNFIVTADQNKLLNFINAYHQKRNLFPAINTVKNNLDITDQQFKEQLQSLENTNKIDKRISQFYLQHIDADNNQQNNVPDPFQDDDPFEEQEKITDLPESIGGDDILLTETNNENITKIDYDKLKKILNGSKNIETFAEKIKNENKIQDNQEVKQIKEKSDIVEKVKITILKSSIGIIGIIAIFINIIFTTTWFDSVFSAWWQSLIFSFCIVSSSVVFFEFLILFVKSKQIKFASLFAFLWGITIIASISFTLSGQLNLQLQKNIDSQEENLVDSNNILLYQDYMSQIKDLKIDLESIRKERDQLQQFLTTTKFETDEEKQHYYDINYLIRLKNNDIKKIKNQIADIEKNKNELLQDNVKITIDEKQDYFDWLSGIFKIRADFFRFILYLFVSLFTDLLCPLSFAAILFYRRKA